MENETTTPTANPVEDQPMMMGEGEDIDEEPQFVSAEDAVEVAVDEENIPMEEDDDDDEAETPTTTDAPDLSTHQIRSHAGPVYAVCAHWNGASLLTVSGGGDDRAYLHSSSTAENGNNQFSSLQLPHAHSDSVSATATNLDCPERDPAATPALIAVAGYDGAIILYDLQGHKLKQLEGPTGVEWLSFHPTGTVLLAGSAADGTVWMYHCLLNQCLQVFVGHESAVTAGAFLPNGKVAVTASADGTVRVWAPKTGQAKHVFRFGNTASSDGAAAGLTCLQVGGGTDGKLVMVGAEDGQAHLCHASTKKVVASLRHSEVPLQQRTNSDDDDEGLAVSVEGVGFCPSNPNWCATAGVDGVLKIWDLTTHQCRQVCRHPEGSGVTRLQWLPQQAQQPPIVVTATTAGTVHLWDARSGVQLQQWTTGSTATLNDMQILPQQQLPQTQSTMIVTAGDDNVVRLFEVDVNQLLQRQQQQP